MTEKKLMDSKLWNSNIVNLIPYDDSQRIEHDVAKAYATLCAKQLVDTQATVYWKGHRYPSKDSNRPNEVTIKANSLEQKESMISIHPLGYVEVTYFDKKDNETYLKKSNMMYVSTCGANKVIINEGNSSNNTQSICELVSKSKTELFHKLVDRFSSAFIKFLDDNNGRFTFGTASFYHKVNNKPTPTIEI